jgi:predicted nucleic acid-binding protein
MTRAVLDSAVLISAFLKPGGVSDGVLHQAYECAFELFLAEEILAETRRVLLEAELSGGAMSIRMKACIASFMDCEALHN